MTVGTEPKPVQPSAVPDKELEAAIADAELLISYNAVHNAQLDSGAVKDVIALGKEIESGPPKVETVTAFWLALNALSNAAAPATPRSIRLVSKLDADGKPTNRGFFNSVFQRHRRITLIFLVLAIALNAYWILAKQTIENLNEAYAKYDTASAELESANFIISTSEKSKPTDPEGKRTLEKVQAAVPNLRAEIKEQKSAIGSHFTVLYYLLATQIDLRTGDPAEKARLAEIVLGYLRDIIGLTLAPLAFGALGACVYVMRRIGNLVAAKALDPDTGFSFKLRIYLGSIAGLAAAQFDIFGKSATVTPLAFAFVAGYAIEVFFSALDRLVGAFSGGDQKATQNPAGR